MPVSPAKLIASTTDFLDGPTRLRGESVTSCLQGENEATQQHFSRTREQFGFAYRADYRACASAHSSLDPYGQEYW